MDLLDGKKVKMEQILPVSIQKVEQYNVFHVEHGEGLKYDRYKTGNRMKIVHNIRGEKLYNVHYFTPLQSILTYQSNSTIVWIWNGFHIGK